MGCWGLKGRLFFVAKDAQASSPNVWPGTFPVVQTSWMYGCYVEVSSMVKMSQMLKISKLWGSGSRDQQTNISLGT